MPDVAGDEQSMMPTGTHQGDFLRFKPDGSLVLLSPDDGRARTVLLVTGALLAGIGLGWVGASNRHLAASMVGLTQLARKEASTLRTSEAPLVKNEGARRSTSTSSLQTPAGASTTSDAAASFSIRSPSTPLRDTHPTTDWSTMVPSALRTNAGVPSASAAAREPLLPVPETKPTTIHGWTVVEVRGGTAVLEGPDGVWRATRGDTVPGIGRIESIVRWGNRWIVATASGLIAAP
jgi:hypothetical protein